MDEYGSGLVVRAQDQMETLRALWRSCSDESLRAKIMEVASTLDELIGDYDRILAEGHPGFNGQQAWRDIILSYVA